MSAVHVFRYPSGDSEYRMSTGTAPKIGDVLERPGTRWIVEAVTKEPDASLVATLRPLEPSSKNGEVRDAG
jgi:hypothetical protein